jgi:hypothetical protein
MINLKSGLKSFFCAGDGVVPRNRISGASGSVVVDDYYVKERLDGTCQFAFSGGTTNLQRVSFGSQVPVHNSWGFSVAAILTPTAPSWGYLGNWQSTDSTSSSWLLGTDEGLLGLAATKLRFYIQALNGYDFIDHNGVFDSRTPYPIAGQPILMIGRWRPGYMALGLHCLERNSIASYEKTNTLDAIRAQTVNTSLGELNTAGFGYNTTTGYSWFAHWDRCLSKGEEQFLLHNPWKFFKNEKSTLYSFPEWEENVQSDPNSDVVILPDTKWKTPPQDNVELDFSNPINRDLLTCNMPTQSVIGPWVDYKTKALSTFRYSTGTVEPKKTKYGIIPFIRRGGSATSDYSLSFTQGAYSVTTLTMFGYGDIDDGTPGGMSTINLFLQTSVIYLDLRISWVGQSEWYYGLRYRTGSSTTYDVYSTTPHADGDRNLIIIRYELNNRISMFVDGVKEIDQTPNAFTTGSCNGWRQGMNDSRQNTHLTAAWLRALSDQEIASLSENPWQLFRKPKRKIFSIPAPTAPVANIPAIITTKTRARQQPTKVTGLNPKFFSGQIYSAFDGSSFLHVRNLYKFNANTFEVKNGFKGFKASYSDGQGCVIDKTFYGKNWTQSYIFTPTSFGTNVSSVAYDRPGETNYDRGFGINMSGQVHGYIYDGLERYAVVNSLTLGKPHCLVMTCTNSLLKVYLCEFNSSKSSMGSQAVSNSGYTSYTLPRFSLGSIQNTIASSVAATIHSATFSENDWSERLVYEFFDNPWQIFTTFKPRLISIPASTTTEPPAEPTSSGNLLPYMW